MLLHYLILVKAAIPGPPLDEELYIVMIRRSYGGYTNLIIGNEMLECMWEAVLLVRMSGVLKHQTSKIVMSFT